MQTPWQRGSAQREPSQARGRVSVSRATALTDGSPHMTASVSGCVCACACVYACRRALRKGQRVSTDVD